MKRKQIYLDDEADRRLKTLAGLAGRSEASLIRDALDRYLDECESKLPPEENPLRAMVGLVDEGPPDGAQEHDRYLYGQ